MSRNKIGILSIQKIEHLKNSPVKTTRPPFNRSISEPPPVKTTPEVDLDVLLAIQSLYDEDSFIYVHCYFDNQWKDMLIRIWKTTFLIDRVSGSRAKLVHAENISFAPQWTLIADGKTHHFLLIFSSLPRDCKVFDLVEEIAQPGGFFVPGISRNEKDVYHVNIP